MNRNQQQNIFGASVILCNNGRGAAVSASGGSVRQDRGRKTKVMQHPAKLETPSSYDMG